MRRRGDGFLGARGKLDLTRARRVGSGMAFWRAASWVEVYFPVLRPVMARASLSAGFIRCLGCFGGMIEGAGGVCLVYLVDGRLILDG